MNNAEQTKLDASKTKTVNRPRVFRIGNVKLTEFTNTIKDYVVKSIKVTKFYKDEKSENGWSETNSFNITELNKLKLLIEEYSRFNNPMNSE